MREIEVELTDEQYAGFRTFANEWASWHLGEGETLCDELALLVCVFYTAVGPVRAGEVGASGADAAEIDMPDLVQVIKWRRVTQARPR